MNHSKFVSGLLKYLNITFAILMLVVLSLDIEQIFHNKRIFDHFSLENDTQAFRDLFKMCQKCQTESLSLITNLNSKIF